MCKDHMWKTRKTPSCTPSVMVKLVGNGKKKPEFQHITEEKSEFLKKINGIGEKIKLISSGLTIKASWLLLLHCWFLFTCIVTQDCPIRKRNSHKGNLSMQVHETERCAEHVKGKFSDFFFFTLLPELFLISQLVWSDCVPNCFATYPL